MTVRGGARTLVVSDVHGNLAALEAALAEPHDAVICLGDLVGFGPEAGDCVRRLRGSGAIVVQGNHDHAIGEGADPGGREPFRSLAQATRALQDARLDTGGRAYLRKLPRSRSLEMAGVRTLLVHATPRDPLYRAVSPEVASWAREVEGVEAELVLVGHTHVQFELRVGTRQVVNPGSVGWPLDGEPGAAYALVEAGSLTLRRVGYDIEATVRALKKSGLAVGVLEELTEWLRSGRAPAQGARALTDQVRGG